MGYKLNSKSGSKKCFTNYAFTKLMYFNGLYKFSITVFFSFFFTNIQLSIIYCSFYNLTNSNSSLYLKVYTIRISDVLKHPLNFSSIYRQ